MSSRSLYFSDFIVIVLARVHSLYSFTIEHRCTLSLLSYTLHCFVFGYTSNITWRFVTCFELVNEASSTCLTPEILGLRYFVALAQRLKAATRVCLGLVRSGDWSAALASCAAAARRYKPLPSRAFTQTWKTQKVLKALDVQTLLSEVYNDRIMDDC